MAVNLFENSFEIEILIRLLLAGACGLVVGSDRSRRHKTAGIRTYLIVAVGACVYAIVSKYGFLDIVNHGDSYVDVSRVASSIVTGVGFLGAGAILTREDRVEGLSTAAGMWVMAAVGGCVGIGMYAIAILTTALMLFVMIIFKSERLPHIMPTETGRLTVTMDDDMGAIKILEAMLYERNIDIITSNVKRHKGGTVTFTFSVLMPETLDVAETVTQIYKATGARSIDL